jgi:hypothetical protein
MRLRKLGAALLVAAALGAVLASGALAAATTTDVQWFTGSGTGTVLSGSEAMGSAAVGSATFKTKASGNEYELEATGINCIGCTITNTGSTAVGSGELEFTGVKVLKPAGCTTPTTVKTKPLSIQADWMIGTANYIKFEPTAGSTTQFATVTISGCALATSLVPKGTVFVQSANGTGVPKVEQEVLSSELINSTAGGSLKVGLEPASLNGKAKFKMTGTHAGQEFQTH